MNRQQSTGQIFIDPVCFKAVRSDKKDRTVIYQFRTYYFCSPACRKVFEKNPERYLDQKISGGKVTWNYCLDRLKQIAGHKIL